MKTEKEWPRIPEPELIKMQILFVLQEMGQWINQFSEVELEKFMSSRTPLFKRIILDGWHADTENREIRKIIQFRFGIHSENLVVTEDMAQKLR